MFESYANFPFHDTDPETLTTKEYILAKKTQDWEMVHSVSKLFTRSCGAVALFCSSFYATHPSETHVGLSAIGLAAGTYIFRSHIEHAAKNRLMEAEFNYTEYLRYYDQSQGIE